MSKRVVVTGATSFVGAAVVRELLRQGDTVAAVVRPGSKKLGILAAGNGQALRDGRLAVIENELGEPERLPGKLRAVWGGAGSGQPEAAAKSRAASAGEAAAPADAFCHFGWGGSGSAARTDRALQEENVRAALRTMEAARELGCKRFLFSGSQAEYGLHTELMTEESACRPRSLYGEAKLAVRERGGELARRLGLTYLHARIFSAYGPGDHPWTLVESCLDAFLAGGEIRLGACSQLWNFIYIEDLARAVCALLDAPEENFRRVPAAAAKACMVPGFCGTRMPPEAPESDVLRSPVFNLAGTETKPLREFVEEIHALCGGRGSCRYGARGENAEGAVNLIPSIEKLRRVTGFTPEISFETGIKRTIESRRNRLNY